MANFNLKLYDIGTAETATVWSVDQCFTSLQVATALWLRTLGTNYDNQLGLVNFIKLQVPPKNEMYFPCTRSCNLTVCSNGELIRGLVNCKSPILWQREGLHRQLNLEYFMYVSREIRIHISWLEQALALALVSVYNHGYKLSDMIAKKPELIAGIEKVDWL